MAGLSSAITASAAQPLVLLLSLLLLTATISLSVFLELYPKPPMLRWIVLEWLFDTSNMFDMAADVDSSPLLLDVPPQANATTAADAPLPSLSTIVTHCLGVPPPARVTTAAAAAAADWVRSSERFSPSGFRRNVRTLFPCGQAPLGASAAAKLRAHNMLYVHDELDRFCRAGRFTNSTQLAIFFSDDTPPRDSPLPLVVKTRPIGFNSSAVLLPFETDRYYSGALLSSATLVPWARKHDSLVWRGSTTGYGLRRDFVHELAGHARSDIDVRFSGVVQGRSQWTRGGDYVAPPMSRRQLLQHTALVLVPSDLVEEVEVQCDLDRLAGCGGDVLPCGLAVGRHVRHHLAVDTHLAMIGGGRRTAAPRDVCCARLGVKELWPAATLPRHAIFGELKSLVVNHDRA